MKRKHDAYKLAWAALTTSYALPSSVEVIRDGVARQLDALTAANVLQINKGSEQAFNAAFISYDWTKGAGTLLSFSPQCNTDQDAATVMRPMTEGQTLLGVVSEAVLEKTCAEASASLKPISIGEGGFALKAKSDNASGSLVVILTLGSL